VPFGTIPKEFSYQRLFSGHGESWGVLLFLAFLQGPLTEDIQSGKVLLYHLLFFRTTVINISNMQLLSI
jgi:hypothetical protein